MLIVVLAGFLAVVFLILALLIWGVVFWLGHRKVLARILQYTAVAYLIVFLVTAFGVFPIWAAGMISDAGTRPQDRRLELDPAKLGCSFENVSFPSSDGLTLSGWWMDGEAGKPLLFFTHGLFRDRKEVVERACRLNQAGYPVLVYDQRCHGSSGRSRISLGFHERLDVEGAVRFGLEKRPGPFVPAGVSMGAVATLLALPQLPRPPLAVIADSPYLTLRDTVAQHVRLFVQVPAFPFANVFMWRLGRISGFSPDALDVRLGLRAAKPVPVLLIYSREDQRMDPNTAQAVMEAIPHPSKELVFFEDAGHGAAYRTHPDRYVETVLKFLDKFKE